MGSSAPISRAKLAHSVFFVVFALWAVVLIAIGIFFHGVDATLGGAIIAALAGAFSSMIAAGVSSRANWVMWTRLFALPHGLPDCPRSLEGGPWRWREIPLENQRPAAYVHSLHVEREVQRIKKTEERPQRLTAAE